MTSYLMSISLLSSAALGSTSISSLRPQAIQGLDFSRLCLVYTDAGMAFFRDLYWSLDVQKWPQILITLMQQCNLALLNNQLPLASITAQLCMRYQQLQSLLDLAEESWRQLHAAFVDKLKALLLYSEANLSFARDLERLHLPQASQLVSILDHCDCSRSAHSLHAQLNDNQACCNPSLPVIVLFEFSDLVHSDKDMQSRRAKIFGCIAYSFQLGRCQTKHMQHLQWNLWRTVQETYNKT